MAKNVRRQGNRVTKLLGLAAAAVVIHVDNPALASMVLSEEHFVLLDENDWR
ncbi:MAG: hypothetical protein HKL95_09805 [Phycisphaerae bacterium]|nr:hypothetical protein [Phycisphaerae bacterium]